MKTKIKGFLALAIIISLTFVSIVSIAIAQTITSNTYTVSTTLTQSNPVTAQALTVNIGLSTTGAGVQNGIVQAQIFNSSNT
ncbi:MAG: hypothetical protein WCW46_04060, partial [Candidatus Paceibacterota bacterium]